MMGHASAAMTVAVYAGLFDDELDDVADRMGAAAESARMSARMSAQRMSARTTANQLRTGPTPDGKCRRCGALISGDGGAACRNRTDDLFITSESLCRLS
jgi:hypothetical protein